MKLNDRKAKLSFFSLLPILLMVFFTGFQVVGASPSEIFSSPKAFTPVIASAIFISILLLHHMPFFLRKKRYVLFLQILQEECFN
jgi:hypothetical protein